MHQFLPFLPLRRMMASLVLCFSVLLAHAQVSITGFNAPVTEDFNTLANTGTGSAVPAGWAFLETGTNANATYTAGTGSGNAGDTYSFGAAGSTERAFGGLQSGSLVPTVGGSFVNNTGAEITSLTITYTGEQWRLGAASRTAPDRLDFQYSTNATALNSGTWTDADALDFNAPVTSGTVGLLDGNAAANRREVTFMLTGLSVPAGGTVWVRWSSVDVSGSDDGLAIDDFSITANGAVVVTPALVVTPNAVDFGAITISSAAVRTFTVTGTNLTDGVTVTVPVALAFSLSKDSAVFGATVSFTAAEVATPQRVFVRFQPSTNIPFSDVATVRSSGAADQTVTLGGSGSNPFSEDFNICSTALPGGWTQFSVSGAQTWACTTFGRNLNAVQINGFVTGTGAVENQDWLISPALDLRAFTFPLLSFWSRTRFAGPSLRLFVSTDYSGSGSPLAATWTELNGQFPLTNSDVWTQSSNINLAAFKQPSAYVAFVYDSSPVAGAARWTVDDFNIVNSLTPPPPQLSTSITPLSDFNFDVIAANTPSDVRPLVFSLANATDSVFVSVPAPFQLSKDGVTFSHSVAYGPADAADSVFVRALPTTEGTFAGRFNFRSGTLNSTQGYLTASSINKDKTFDVVTFNVEWFGSPSNGPTNNALQASNLRTVIQRLDADVYAFQEISDVQLFTDSIANRLPNYRFAVSPAVSNAGDNDPFAQKVIFLYKNATVTPLATKPLLTGVDVNTLTDYPDPDRTRFWASGRLPFLLDAQVNIGGVSKRVALVNIHARANSNANAAEALSRYQMRAYDVKVLKDTLDAFYRNVPVVLLGDYNDDVDSTVANIPSPRVSSYQPYNADTAQYRIPTRSLSDAGLRSFIDQANVIDHIAVNRPLFGESLGGSARVELPFSYVTNYQNTTSDHLPVSARFRFAPPPVTTAAVRPVLECVVVNPNGTYTARFGYQNDNTVAVTIPVGTNNRFSPNPQDRSQTTTFLPGRQRNVFSVTFNGSPLVWSLRGPDNRNRTSTASIASKRCDGTLNLANELAGLNNLILSLFPNPTNGRTVIQLNEALAQARVRVFDAFGKEHTVPVSGLGTATLEVDLQALPAGLYSLRVESAQAAQVMRVVKL